MGKAPLVRAVAQLVFPPSAHLVTPQAIAQIQEELEPRFRLEAETLAGLQISIGTTPASPQRYVFSHQEGYELVITPQSLTLAIDGERYKDREAFQTILAPQLELVGRIGKIKEYLRLGVRYINAAPASVDDFLKWFTSEFTGWGGGNMVSPDAKRAWVLMTQIDRSASDSPVNAATVRYGYLTNGVGADVTSAAAASEPSFLADIDMACIHPGPYEAIAIAEIYRRINREIAAFFEQSLSPDGIEHFALAGKE